MELTEQFKNECSLKMSINVLCSLFAEIILFEHANLSIINHF